MKFKEFFYREDNGLMGFGIPSSGRKPSDGMPFKNLTDLGKKSGAMNQPAVMMMRKMMKKKMKKE